MRLRFFFLSVVLLFLMGSCIEEKFDGNDIDNIKQKDLGLALPVGYKKTGVEDAFPNQLSGGSLIVDKDKLLWFSYKTESLNLKAKDLIQFQETELNYALPLFQNNIEYNTDSILHICDTLYLDLGFSKGTAGEKLDSISLNNLKMEINLSSDIINSMLNLTFPSVLYNGKAYSKNLKINSENNFNDFYEYTVALTEVDGKHNQLPIIIETSILPENINNDITENSLNIEMKMSEIDFSGIFGYIGQLSINTDEMAAALDLSNRHFSGYFNFSEPQINLSYTNSFGVPFGFQMDKFSITSIDGQSTIDYNTSSDTKAIISAVDLSKMGESIKDSSAVKLQATKISFDNQQEIRAIISGETNPDETDNYNFVLDESELTIEVDFRVPFAGNTNGLVFTDTLKYNVEDILSKEFDKITKIGLILQLENSFPFDYQLQAFFLDASQNTIMTLFDNPVEIKGQSSEDVKSTEAYIAEPVTAMISDNEIEAIKSTKYVVINALLKTIDFDNSPNTTWLIYNYDYLRFDVGIAVELNDE